MPEQARLKIYGYGEVEVELIIACLSDLKFAYDAISVFILEVDAPRRAERDFPFSRYPFWPGRSGRYFRETPPSSQMASFLPRSEHLVLNAVQLASPGFWEFLGSLIPLEVVRKYLSDRHEQRKDREYRESADKRRLRLENLSLENKVIRERIEIAKSLGATDSDLAPLLNSLIFRPLSALDQYQDKGMIEGAELVTLEAPTTDTESDLP